MARKREGVVSRHDLDAERAVLAGIRGDPAMMDTVLEVISALDFYREAHRTIFKAMVDLHKSGESVDLVTIVSRLSTLGQIEEVGGVAALAGLHSPSVAGILSHAKIVADCAQSRRVLELAQDLAEATLEATPADIHEAATKLAREAEPRRVKRSDVSAADLIQRYADRYDRPDLEPTRPPIATPWEPLTKILNGGWTGGRRPYYLGARRKVGKTSAAIEVAVDAATTQGANVVMFEMELDMDELMARMVASYAEVPLQTIQRRQMDAWQEQHYVKALEHCYTDRLRIDASRFDRHDGRMDRVKGSRTIEGIRRTLQRIRADRDVSLVVVDHLQRIEPPFPCPIFERVSQASQGIAELAQETGIPFVVMIQLNDGDGAPTMDDVRGSKEINNDCEALILLDRPPIRRSEREQARLSDSEKEEADITVALHGSGSTGTIPMRYVGSYMRWYQAEAREEPSWFGSTSAEVNDE